MNNQIFLRLIRTGDIPAVTNAAAVKNWLSEQTKNAIMGDALEVPFLKWINVTGFKNSIGFDSGTIRSIEGGELKEKKYGTSAGSYSEALNANSGYDRDAPRINPDRIDIGDNRRVRINRYRSIATQTRFGTQGVFRPTVQDETFSKSYAVRQADRGGQSRREFARLQDPAGGVQFSGDQSRDFFSLTRFENSKLKIKLPDHGSLTFTKNTDNSTPQLAFACSAQEPIKHAFFAFRRRVGTGVQGIRVPYMIVWCRECLVTGWELNGDMETVTIKYKKIKWCSYDQVTDWNVPTGMSNREWDVQDEAGGEDVTTYVVMGVLAAATVALGAGLALGMTPMTASYRDADRSLGAIE